MNLQFWWTGEIYKQGARKWTMRTNNIPWKQSRRYLRLVFRSVDRQQQVYPLVVSSRQPAHMRMPSDALLVIMSKYFTKGSLTWAAATIAAWGPRPSVASLTSLTRSLVSLKSIHFSAPSERTSSFFSAPVSAFGVSAYQEVKDMDDSPMPTTRRPIATAYWTATTL